VSERGEYRSIPLALIDGPDFQRLPERARWVFVALKLNLGPVGIGVWYPAELVARLSAQSGASAAGVQDALMTLEREGWIQREGNVLWIVKQLEFDPHVKLANPKHRKMVQTVVGGLPRLAIVGRFIRYYELWFRADGEPHGSPSEPLRRAIDSLSDSLSAGYRGAIESQEGIGEGIGIGSLGSSDDDPGGKSAYPPEFETVWAIYPKRTGGNPKKEAHTAWRARLRAGVPVEVLHRGAAAYAAFCDAEGKTGTQFVMQAATFFGPGERYLETWAASPPPAPQLRIVDSKASALWTRYRDAQLLTRWPREELDRIGQQLVAAGHYPDLAAFFAEISLTKPWELADSRTDHYAIGELSRRLGRAS
jgi:hypothetical protein